MELNNPLSLMGLPDFVIEEIYESKDINKLVAIAEGCFKNLTKHYHPDRNHGKDLYMNALTEAMEEIRDTSAAQFYLDERHFQITNSNIRISPRQNSNKQASMLALRITSVLDYVNQYALLDIDYPLTMCALSDNVMTVLDVLSGEAARLRFYDGSDILDDTSKSVRYQKRQSKSTINVNWQANRVDPDKKTAHSWSSPALLEPEQSNLKILGVYRGVSNAAVTQRVNIQRLATLDSQQVQRKPKWVSFFDAGFLAGLEPLDVTFMDESLASKTPVNIILYRNANAAHAGMSFAPEFCLLLNVVKIEKLR